MIDLTQAHLALRTRARSTSVCTTGVGSFSATALGFRRQTGSFVSDGFYAGMEVVAVGFSADNNAPKVIKEVTAQFLSIVDGCVAQPASNGRSISVGLPSRRAWENKDFTPETGFPYVAEEFVPATSSLLSFPAEGGLVKEQGRYYLTIYGVWDYGFPAIRKTIDAMKALFAPGTVVIAGADAVRIRSDASTQAGQIIPTDNGWARCKLSIPWEAYTINAVAP